MRWLDPVSGRALQRDSAHALTDGTRRWPVAGGIAFLRADRQAMCREALAALDAGDEPAALALLLTDQDPFAPLPPPTLATTAALVDAVRLGRVSLRDAMQALNFGPVADYFAYRAGTPTHLSGLGLLANGGRPGGAVIELACGIGHTLRELLQHGVPACGVDLVFAKLWLARRFVAPEAELVCADATLVPLAPLTLTSTPTPTPAPALTVFCHDAFYFFADKAAAASHWMRLAGHGGRVLVGHAHNADIEHGVAGTPLDAAGYAALLPGSALFDDAALTTSALRGVPAVPCEAQALRHAEAVALVWPGDGVGWWPEVLLPPPALPLRLNPLLQRQGGRIAPRWPSVRFAAEYAASSEHLYNSEPTEHIVAQAARGRQGDARAATLARRRVLVDLPERW